jgi:hypothetical protein
MTLFFGQSYAYVMSSWVHGFPPSSRHLSSSQTTGFSRTPGTSLFFVTLRERLRTTSSHAASRPYSLPVP